MAIESPSIQQLAYVGTLMMKMWANRVVLIGWDGEEASNPEGWRELVRRERAFTVGPVWDSALKIRWLTRAEWDQQKELY